ncbi:hypothetical protein GGR57DRAFT_507558 [Xylariaceae sp. FL1272]|nr:hypothetical protein GGR57DRAFT_507558 [Xylariaceae sp. FL1272]
MLATLKTGSAILSLEPAHPVDRLKSILEAVNASMLVYSPDHEDLCQSIAACTPIFNASAESLIELPQSNEDFRLSGVSPSNAAYVVSTSGSTSGPKGVVVEHRAFASNIKSQQKALHMDFQTRALQFASYAFDAYLVESLSIFATGGCAYGARAWIVYSSDYDELSPIGAVGELLVEGPGLARGYLSDQAKTAKSTGDLVQYDFAGSILYVGCKDTQVKIHGERLEVEEVEHHLLQNSNVAQAAAVLSTRGNFQKSLTVIISLQKALYQITDNSVGFGIDVLRGVARDGRTAKLIEQIYESL